MKKPKIIAALTFDKGMGKTTFVFGFSMMKLLNGDWIYFEDVHDFAHDEEPSWRTIEEVIGDNGLLELVNYDKVFHTLEVSIADICTMQIKEREA